MADKRLLISYAHPDDESFGLGGLIAKYVKAGIQVDLICATNGDVGTIDPELLEGYASHAELRLSELDCASALLGLTNVVKLNYKDSGMMGSEFNQDPDCLWATYAREPETVTRRVVEVLRELRPQVVITFNKYGGYGHPDHIAIQQATVEAFKLVNDPDYVTDGLPAYQPQKLYYSSIPAWAIRLGIFMSRLRGQNPRALGRNKDIDIVKILDNVEPVHVKVNVTDYMDDWAEASACHKSQGGGGRSSIFPMWLRRLLGVKQGFTRVYPAPVVDKIDEDDLFDNVTVDEAVLEPML